MTANESDRHFVLDLEERPFVGVTRTVTMSTIRDVADQIPRLLRWLGERGQAPAGAPFLRYLVIDMAGDMVIQAGVPVTRPLEVSDDLEAGVLPAGRYVTTTHVGPFEGLYDATGELLQWAGERDLHFDHHPSDRGDVWGSRVEWYETNILEQPDAAQWVTRLTFRLAD